ncbi:MAG: carbon storage regulator CsrA [Alphaproteobacteria bacterium]
MLFLTRKPGESIIINDNIVIEVVYVKGQTVKLGFAYPPDVRVYRRELYERILQENTEASENALPVYHELKKKIVAEKE